MSGELVRASDDDRDRAVLALREHLAAGRLTLEEFTERMSTALAATTTADLDPPLCELPAAAAPPDSLPPLGLQLRRTTGAPAPWAPRLLRGVLREHRPRPSRSDARTRR